MFMFSKAPEFSASKSEKFLLYTVWSAALSRGNLVNTSEILIPPGADIILVVPFSSCLHGADAEV